MNIRVLRVTLQQKLCGITGWWLNKKQATDLAILLRYLELPLLEELEKDVASGRIKGGQHSNYYKTILWKRMQDSFKKQPITKGIQGTESIKSILERIFNEKKPDKNPR